ncbi:MAG: thioredoxin family protein [Bacteroidota bacterium]
MVPVRPLALAVCALACLSAPEAQPLEWATLSQAPTLSTLDWRPLPEALALAQASDVPTLIYVQAAWCGPCRRLERDTFADTNVQARLARFALAQLTFDDRDRQHRIGPYRRSEAEWARRFGASATPTLVLLSPDGSVLGRHTGFLPPEGLLPILDAALAAPTQSHSLNG